MKAGASERALILAKAITLTITKVPGVGLETHIHQGKRKAPAVFTREGLGVDRRVRAWRWMQIKVK